MTVQSHTGAAAPGTETPAIRDRVAALESALGDALGDGPLGHDAVLDADRVERLPEGGEELLDAHGVYREFVPENLGGSYTALDALTVLLRAVARRDFGVALSYGAAVFVPAVALWCDGSADQQQRAARLLGRGERLAMAFHDLSHGNDFVASGIWVRPQPDGGLLLGGHKRVVTNAARAAGLVVLARSGRHGDGAGHCALYVERAELDPGTLRDLQAVPGAGPRRAPSGGLEFLDCAAPPEALIGELNQGTQIMLRALQVTRPLAPSMGVGCADTALRMAAAAAEREGGGDLRSVDSRYARRVLGSAFLDLLVCDALLLTATRTVHLLPQESSLSTAVAKYLVPRVLNQTVTDLVPVLGRCFQRDEGGAGTFRKHLRDLAALPPGHAGSAAALASILPQLPTLARRSWNPGPAGPPELFELDTDVPALEPALLYAAAPTDTLVRTLAEAADSVESAFGRDEQAAALRAATRTLADELELLRKECRALPERDPAVLATPRAYALAERYALLVGAAACLGVWNSARRGGGDAFLSDLPWVIGALGRICLRLGLPSGHSDVEHCYAPAVFDEFVRRFAGDRAFDLYDTALGRAR